MRVDWKFKSLFVIGFLLLAVDSVIPWLSMSEMRAAQEKHDASRQRIEFIHEYLAALIDAESGQRGFIITGKEDFLLPYQLAVSHIAKDTPDIERMIADEPRWQIYGREIISFSNLKLEYLAKTIALRRQNGFAAVEPIISTAEGKYFMDRVRAAVEAGVNAETAERNRLSAELDRQVEHLANVSLIAGIVNLFLLTVGLRFLFRTLTERQRSAQSYQQLNEQLGAGMAQLALRNREMALLGQMARALESHISLQEAFGVIVTYLPKLLSGTSGALYLLRPSGNLLEQVGRWGTPLHAPQHIEPDACWAVRRGQPHAAAHADDLGCPHYREPGAGEIGHLCLPLTAQGAVLGLICIEAPAGNDAQSASTRTLEALALPIAEQVALALSSAQLRQILREQSIMDSLTGMYNRRYMEETLQRELARAARAGAQLSIVMYDLDHFKKINDTHGHDAGDAVLKACAAHVKQSVRESDVPCRLGGEEFVLILPDCSKPAAIEKAERIRQGVSRLRIMHDRSLCGQVTATFSVATFPVDGASAEVLLTAADAALYHGKNAGRDRVVGVQTDLAENL